MAGAPPRNPRDLQGLLKFCMEATKSEDAPSGGGDLQAMDPERRAWLEQALKDMTVDVFQELAKCIAALTDESVVADKDASDLSAQMEAIDCLLEWLGEIDLANNFHKLGGFVALTACLESPHDDLAAGGCSLIAELAQNNPYCQEKLLEEGFLPSLLRCCEDGSSTKRCLKCLTAISCLTRGYDPARRALLDSDGLAIVLRMLQSNLDGRFRSKACFFLAALMSEDSEVVAALVRLGLPELLAAILDEGESDDEVDGGGASWREHAASALLVVSRNSKEAVVACKRLGKDIVVIVDRRLSKIKGKEEFREEEEHYQELLKIYENSSSDVDR